MKKNIFNKAAAIILTTLSLLIMAGCNNITGTTVNSEKVKVNISLEEPARLLNANPQSSELTDFVLTAAVSGGNAEEAGRWATYTELTQAQIELAPGSYTFTLTSKNDVFVYNGSVTKTLSSGQSVTLNFKLSLDAEAALAAMSSTTAPVTGNGAADIYIYYKDNTGDLNTSILLYTDEGIASGIITDLKTSLNIPPVDGTGSYSGYKLIHYVNNEIPCGLYNFSISIENDRKMADRSEQMLVCPGKTINATYVIDDYADICKITYDFQLYGMQPYEFKLTVSNRQVPVFDLQSYFLSSYNFGDLELDGWYRNPQFTGEAVTAINPLTESKEITLYAKWRETADDLVVEAISTGFSISSFTFRNNMNCVAIYINGLFIRTLYENNLQPFSYSLVEPGESYTFSYVAYKSSEYPNSYFLTEEYVTQNRVTKAPITAIGGSGEVTITNFNTLEAAIDWSNGTVELNETPVLAGVNTGDVISYYAEIYDPLGLELFFGNSENTVIPGSEWFAFFSSWLEEYDIFYSISVNDECIPQIIKSTVKNPLIGKQFTYNGEDYAFTKYGIVSTSAEYVKDNKCSLECITTNFSEINDYDVTLSNPYYGFYVLINGDGAPFARCLGEDEIFIAELNLYGDNVSFVTGNTISLYDAYDFNAQEITQVTIAQEPEDIHVTMTAQGNTLNISVPEEFTNVEWEIFGTTLTGNSHPIDISSKNSGNYECFVLGTKDGIEYSESFIFTLKKE